MTVNDIKTMSDIRAFNKEKGKFFFSRDTMRFFKSRIETSAMKGNEKSNRFFVSSESYNGESARIYKLRFIKSNGEIEAIAQNETGKESLKVIMRSLPCGWIDRVEKGLSLYGTENLVLYERGELYIYDTITPRLRSGVNKNPLVQFMVEHPRGEVMTFDNALELMKEAACAAYRVGQFKECSEEYYYEMLEVLPPLNWSENSFFMSEFDTGTITSQFVKHNGKYYCGSVDYCDKTTWFNFSKEGVK